MSSALINKLKKSLAVITSIGVLLILFLALKPGVVFANGDRCPCAGQSGCCGSQGLEGYPGQCCTDRCCADDCHEVAPSCRTCVDTNGNVILVCISATDEAGEYNNVKHWVPGCAPSDSRLARPDGSGCEWYSQDSFDPPQISHAGKSYSIPSGGIVICEPNAAPGVCAGEPLPGQDCVTDFPESVKCCPLESGKPSWLTELGGLVDNVLTWLLDHAGITFTLVANPNLDRSDQLPKDADYLWASYEERYDPRRISLPDEEPENEMWPGVAARIAPPEYRPPETWDAHRKVRLKWDIPLEEDYEVEDWWGDDGIGGDKSRSAHHPLMMGANDAWNWFINVPGLEEEEDGGSIPQPLAHFENFSPQLQARPLGKEVVIAKDRSQPSYDFSITKAPSEGEIRNHHDCRLAQSEEGEVLAEDEANLCNPPYPADYRNVCSVAGERKISAGRGLYEILKQLIGGGVSIFPRFPWLDTISHRLTGILNKTHKSLKEKGIGGVFNAFLPPGWSGDGEIELPSPNEFEILDAPSDLGLQLKVKIDIPCVFPFHKCHRYQCCTAEGVCEDVPSCEECPAPKTCEPIETGCCLVCPSTGCIDSSYSATLDLKPEDHDELLIRYLGSQTEALYITQTWLAPPGQGSVNPFRDLPWPPVDPTDPTSGSLTERINDLADDLCIPPELLMAISETEAPRVWGWSDEEVDYFSNDEWWKTADQDTLCEGYCYNTCANTPCAPAASCFFGADVRGPMQFEAGTWREYMSEGLEYRCRLDLSLKAAATKIRRDATRCGVPAGTCTGWTETQVRCVARRYCGSCNSPACPHYCDVVWRRYEERVNPP